MKKSSASLDHVPRCALNSQESSNSGNSISRTKGDNLGKPFARFPTNRGSANNPQNLQRHIKQEYPGNPEWTNTFDNSNTSWDSEWPTTPSPSFPKNSTSGNFYKQRSVPSSFHSSSNDWSTGESSTGSSTPSSYAGMQATHPPPSPSPYYENSNFCNSDYSYASNLSGYAQPPYRTLQQPPSNTTHQYHQSVRPCDTTPGFYNGNRNPSSCPPKQPVPDYNQRNSRYGMEHILNKVQIKREPEDFTEAEGDNFSSVLINSLNSLYPEDPDNAYREDGKSFEPDIIICSPPPSNIPETQTNYQRLGPSDGHYNSNASNYHGTRNNTYGFYENRSQNSEPAADVVELGSENERSNSFRYDRPSFDDMHLYTPPNESKNQNKRRKLSMPSIAPDSNFGSETRRKVPRMSSFKSDSKWTPNSFTFSDIQIKQEPEDDYPTMEKETQNNKTSLQDNSLNNNGSSHSKNPSQQLDHPKPPPRKRSPAATCFDRFEKKSTPTNKKVSPLSVYAKVQDSVVLSVKCRRYKKRTKPIVSKEELVYPGREEIENWKRTGAYSQTPDHAVRILMGELLERVSQVDGKNINNGPDLKQLDTSKLRELVYQFCQRYSIDFRDFDDIHNVLKPRIVEDKTAKNSERASAIRKRTDVSPAPKDSKELPNKIPKVERKPKKANKESLNPAAKRVLRNLPGREQMPEAMETEIKPNRRRSSKTPIVSRRRYSTRSARDGNDKDSDVDIVIDSSTDRESEAGKEAEVRKKSDRYKTKQPVAEKPAKTKSFEKVETISREAKKELPTPRPKEKSKERDSSMEKLIKEEPKTKWSRKQGDFRGILRSSSIEIVDITRSDSSSLSELKNDVKEVESNSKKEKRISRKFRNSPVSSRDNSVKRREKDSAKSVSRKNGSKNQNMTNERSDRNGQSGIVLKTSENKIPKEKFEKTDFKPSVNEKCVKSERLIRSSRRNHKDGSASQSNTNTEKHLKQKESKHPNAIDKSNDSLRQDSTKKCSSLIKESQPPEEGIKKNVNAKNLIIKDLKGKKDEHLNDKIKISLISNINSKFKNFEHANVVEKRNISSKIKEKDLLIKSEVKSEVDATSDEKLSALNRCSKLSLHNKVHSRSQNKLPYRMSYKDDETHENLKLFTKIKEEPLSPDSEKPKQLNFPIKKRAKNVQIAVNKPDIVSCKKEEVAYEKTKREIRNGELRNKVAKSSSQLSQKQLKSRRNSQQSDSEPQVVLMKLPDAHINSKKSTIPLDYFEKYVSKEINRSFAPDESKSKCSDDSSSVGSPPELVCMKEIYKEDEEKAFERDSSSKLNSNQKDYPSAPLPLIHCDEFMGSAKSKSTEQLEKSQSIKRSRYSADSEDSECRLVIDLDRSVSFEKDTSCAALSDGESIDEKNLLSTPEIYHSSTQCVQVPQETAIAPSDIKKPVIVSSESNPPKVSNSCNSNGGLVEEATETNFSNAITDDHSSCASTDACMTAPSDESNDIQKSSSLSKTNNANTSKIKECESLPLEAVDEQTNARNQNRVESILRSLLLERTADGSTGPIQPSTSSGAPKTSRDRMSEDIRRFLMNQERLTPTDSVDPLTMIANIRSSYEDSNGVLDLVHRSSRLLSDAEKLILDSRLVKVQIDKLWHDMMYLQCITYLKEKGHVGTICLKGTHSPNNASALLKETDSLSVSQEKLWTLIERLEKKMKSLDKNLFPEYMIDLLKKLKRKCQVESKKIDKSSTLITNNKTVESDSNSEICHHFLEMAAIALTIAECSVAAVVVVNENRIAAVNGEQLSTVEAMVAKANENYGFDFRGSKASNETATSPILEQVLLSKGPKSNQTNQCSVIDVSSDSNSSVICESPKKIKRKIPSGNESPFKPITPSISSESKAMEEGLSQKILLKALSEGQKNTPSSSQFLPAAKKETRLTSLNSHNIPSTSYQEDIPLDFSLVKKSDSRLKSSDIPFAHPNCVAEKSKSNLNSSLKLHPNTSYSIWKHSKTTKNKSPAETLALVTDRVLTQDNKAAPKTTSSSSTYSNSTDYLIRPSSAHYPAMTQNSVLNIFHQQRSGSANLLHASSNHMNLSAESALNGLYLSRSGSAHTDSRIIQNVAEQYYNGKRGGNRRWPEHRQNCPKELFCNSNGPSYTENSKSPDH